MAVVQRSKGIADNIIYERKYIVRNRRKKDSYNNGDKTRLRPLYYTDTSVVWECVLYTAKRLPGGPFWSFFSFRDYDSPVGDR